MHTSAPWSSLASLWREQPSVSSVGKVPTASYLGTGPQWEDRTDGVEGLKGFCAQRHNVEHRPGILGHFVNTPTCQQSIVRPEGCHCGLSWRALSFSKTDFSLANSQNDPYFWKGILVTFKNFQAATDKTDHSQDSFTLKLEQTLDLKNKASPKHSFPSCFKLSCQNSKAKCMYLIQQHKAK